MSTFYQEGPVLGNTYESDGFLKSCLTRMLPGEILREIQPHLDHLGHRAANDLLALARQAETHPPVHIPFDAWGRRVDEIETHPSWDLLKRAAAEEGLVATGYERKYGSWSRLYQMTLLHLYHPSSAVFSCPLAMTDGTARAIELYGDESLKENAYANLTSRDPDRFWTSGQWMTERTGGSDVGGTSTIARPDGQGGFRLQGTKWFTSATTSEMAMTLARIEGAPEGSKGLSLFYLELRDPAGRLNQIEVHRLKDKLGTRALPTAELTLHGTPAQLVGGEGHGVRKIASLFNITRVYNAVCAVSSMGRGLTLAKDYARKRRAFGKRLLDHPLHAETLADLETDYRICLSLVLQVARFLGEAETDRQEGRADKLLRILTPITKLFTAKLGVASASEVLESFGGAGYVEDTHLPMLLRDGQVLAIWEGTTNILSLDMLRAISKEDALAPLVEDARRRLGDIDQETLAPQATILERELDRWLEHFQFLAKTGREALESQARTLAMNLGRCYAGILLLEHAQWEWRQQQSDLSLLAARRWCARPPIPMKPVTNDNWQNSTRLAFGTVE
ncbi:Acyl-CoA dehydrogenase family protein [Sulfidibacter corallicola]|uniref:Acyl-CoA dehydrogenase family protein n=1 Tax=Sulfidibacter corallicola TaxID=2818388 RepID=A0A8A4TCQ5_SULCO|nr:acyl-CoA dehydrogenase family protein [Sulfidibacter corallicola]QTD47879.1 acyl-CoA dehydrogenase family protein [Sulfidibacter corallicola]